MLESVRNVSRRRLAACQAHNGYVHHISQPTVTTVSNLRIYILTVNWAIPYSTTPLQYPWGFLTHVQHNVALAEDNPTPVPRRQLSLSMIHTAVSSQYIRVINQPTTSTSCIANIQQFCCAMLCTSAAYAVVRCLSSVRHVRVVCRNGHSSFLLLSTCYQKTP